VSAGQGGDGFEPISGNPPPLWFGPIFVVAGSLVTIYGKPSPGVPPWVALLGSGIFVVVGICMTLWSAGFPRASRWAGYLFMLMFAALFHWISFGPGERLGTSTFAFGSAAQTVRHTDVKGWFAAGTVLFDALFVLAVVDRYRKRRDRSGR
jgi:hypothetical protein